MEEKAFGKKWQKGETLGCVIGPILRINDSFTNGITYAAVANEKYILQPKVIKEVFSVFGEVTERSKPTVKKKLTFLQIHLN